MNVLEREERVVWTRGDLDELTTARLFCNFPLIVIRDIDARLE